MTTFEKLEKEYLEISAINDHETNEFVETSVNKDWTYELIRMRVSSDVYAIFNRIMNQANDLHRLGIEIFDEWVKERKEEYRAYFLKAFEEFWPEE